MKDRARKQFEEWAHSYDRSFLHHFLFRPSYLLLMEEIAKWFDRNQKPFRVLDIGCGTGELASMLAHSDWPVQVVGLDYSPLMCSRATEKTRKADLHYKSVFTAADSEFLPFKDATFDVVTCSNSFHHYPNQPGVVKGIRRLIKSGGMFVLIDGFRDNTVGWVAFDVIIHKVEGGIYHAPWSEIDGFFRDAGFENVRRRKGGFWTPICATVGDVYAQCA